MAHMSWVVQIPNPTLFEKHNCIEQRQRQHDWNMNLIARIDRLHFFKNFAGIHCSVRDSFNNPLKSQITRVMRTLGTKNPQPTLTLSHENRAFDYRERVQSKPEGGSEVYTC